MATKLKRDAFVLDYRVCRNISSPEDVEAGRRVYSGQAAASAVLLLEDDENVREYLVNAAGKQKQSSTLVHQAIRKTLRDHPDQFNILNGGMVIVARGGKIDDTAKSLTLDSPSIINGSQTQGELRRYFDEGVDKEAGFNPSIKFELIITDDSDLIAEVSIARNFQNDVRPISIAGRRGQLDDLEEAMQRRLPTMMLRKSESDIVVDDGRYLDTEKLIQVTFALMPEKVLSEIDRLDASNKVFTYSQKTRCLKLFQRVVDEGGLVYDAFIQLAPIAWSLYEHWKSHQGFKGTRIRSITREDGKIIEVPDGVIFPIIAAHAEFVSKVQQTWDVRKPNVFTDDELIEAAKQAYMEIADHNPQTMGKSKACYSTLAQITSIYARFARRTRTPASA
ncbi:AIPR family protein [Sphingomonas sp. CFBP 8764]|uniref:AIPR family protein n=1 Tax=Sphingomonas sp. CFBP 8764 TaxID=2775275 RepID=UPI0017803CD7|nr:AIPR family protein [Sphingomonas sp. CFBP 8764]MBD8552559.1 AIPR family protein [Sphingomonas sp. CFBP 8764]